MNAPLNCSRLHYPECQKSCTPSEVRGHSPSLRQKNVMSMYHQTMGTENNIESDDCAHGMRSEGPIIYQDFL